MTTAQSMEEELQQSVLRAADENLEDAEGEVDYDYFGGNLQVANGEDPNDGEDVEEDEDDDEEEGVGAVKMKPGDSDEDADDGSNASEVVSGDDEGESEEEAAWEDARDDVDREEESDTAPTNLCQFCKQDEENDPSEDFEAFLTCRGCGENSHQQCARNAAALSEQNGVKRWKCPECYNGDTDHEEEEYSDEEARPVSQHSDVSMQDEDDAADQELGQPSGNDGSVGGSRPRRKRKSSPVMDEIDGTSMPKRRRNGSLDPDEDGTDRGTSREPSASRAARKLRLKVNRATSVAVEKKTRTSLIVKLRVRSGNLKEILSRKKRDKRRPAGSARPPRSTPQIPRASITPAPPAIIETPFTTDSYSQPFYSFFDKETDDAKGKPYGGILTEAEADTSKTLPMPDNRRRFDQAKQRAEDEWRARVIAMQAEIAEGPARKPRKAHDHHASQIECIEFGGWEIDTWYAAPYPAEYSRNRVLYICEFCLKYMNSDYVAWRHKLKCPAKHPPGDEIYRQGSISVFEVDGRKNPVYCQNLCLLAKLFLGSKTLYYDVEPFLFYVLCEFDECGYHFVGYFSKEKRSSSQFNVSCILTLPIHQRKGYGNLLIDFSYLLTKVEQKTGSPEKPLSDMGLVSYRNYWRLILCQYFLDKTDGDKDRSEGLSIKSISDDTGMTADDVVAALEGLRALVRDPQTKLYAFRIDLEYCRQYVDKWESKGYVKLKPDALAWTPYVMGRNNLATFELGPISTIAPREGDDDEARVDEGPNSVVAIANPTLNLNRDLPTAVVELDVPPDEVEMNSQDKPPSTDEEEDKENAGLPNDNQADNPDAWKVAYKDVPPSRFEVFPHIGPGRRPGARPSVGRPAVARSSSGVARPRRPAGSARRLTSSRPRPSSTRKKTGGTGRGPGRWPKGTKKSDYGNADSGPGLPPGWLERQVKLKALAEAKKGSALTAAEEQQLRDDDLAAVTAMNGQLPSEDGDGLLDIDDVVMVESDIAVDAEGEDG